MSEFAGIRKALEIASENGFAEVEFEVGGVKFSGRLERRKRPQASGDSTDSKGVQSDSPRVSEIVSPCVGYFSPGKPEVTVGSKVESSQIVGVITALGLANDVESKSSGEVKEVLAREGEPVEYGQPLFRVKVGT